MTAKSIAFGLALAFAGVCGASASEALFTVVDVDVNGEVDNALSFELPQSPPTVDFGTFFIELNVPVVINAGSSLESIAFGSTFPLFDSPSFASTGVLDVGLFLLSGPPLYTGTTSNPTFQAGVYAGLPNAATGNIDTVRITIVPEPATWAMLLLGFVGLVLLRFRARGQHRTVCVQAN